MSGPADVAAFDFDGTLINGGSVASFLMAATSRSAVVTASLALSPALVRGALVGGAAADIGKERLFERVLRGLDAERVAELGPAFARRHLERRLRAQVSDRLDWHRRRGDRVVVVSASPEVYVGPAGRLLGADGVVATRLEVADGVLTGRYDGANCRGQEKVRRVRQWIDDTGGAPRRLWAYGNSRGDLRLLEASDQGVNVGRLGRLGRLRAFPSLARVSADGPPQAGSA